MRLTQVLFTAGCLATGLWLGWRSTASSRSQQYHLTPAQFSNSVAIAYSVGALDGFNVANEMRDRRSVDPLGAFLSARDLFMTNRLPALIRYK